MSRAISLLVGSSGRAEAVGKGLQKLLQGSGVTVEHSRRAGVPAVAAFLPKDQTIGVIKASGATAAVYSSAPSAKLYPNKAFEKSDVTAVVNAIRGAADASTRDTCLRAAFRIAGEKQAGLQVVTGFGSESDWVTPLAEPLKESDASYKAVSVSHTTMAKAVNNIVMFPDAPPAVYLACRGDTPAGVPLELSGASTVRNTMTQLVQGVGGGVPLATFSYHDASGPVVFTGSSELAIFVAAANALKSIGADKEAAAVLAAVAKAVNAQTVNTLAWENTDAAGQAITAKVAA